MDRQVVDDQTEYRIGVATNILDTFRRLGWTPPSELPEYQEKWRRVREQANLISVPGKMK